MAAPSLTIDNVLDYIKTRFPSGKNFTNLTVDDVNKILATHSNPTLAKNTLLSPWPTTPNWTGNKTFVNAVLSPRNINVLNGGTDYGRSGSSSSGSSGSSSSSPGATPGAVGAVASSAFGKVKTALRSDVTLTDKLGFLDFGEEISKEILNSLLGGLSGKLEDTIGAKFKGIFGETIAKILGGTGELAVKLMEHLDTVLDKIIAHAVSVSSKYEDLRYRTLMHAQRMNVDFFDLMNQYQNQEMNSMGITRFEMLEAFIQSSEKLSIRYRTGALKNLNEFVKSASILRRFDVQNASEMFEIMNSSFKKTTRDFNELINRSIGFAQKSGMSYRKYFEDLAKFSEQFSSELDFSRVEKTFKNLTMHAKNLNLEATSLLSSMENFDNAQSMQEAGGRLNAILSSMGSHFDSLHMSTLDLEDRLPYIMKQLRAALPALNSMNANSRRMMMKQLGEISGQIGIDQNSLRKILNAKEEDIEDIADRLKKGDYEYDFTRKGGKPGEIADQVKEAAREAPKDYEKLREDNLPSSMIAAMMSSQKVYHESDHALWTAIGKHIEGIYGSVGKMMGSNTFSLARDRALASSNEKPGDALNNSIKAMTNMIHNLEQFVNQKTKDTYYRDELSGHVRPGTEVEKGKKEQSVTLLDSLDRSGRKHMDAADKIYAAAEMLQKTKIQIEIKDGGRRSASLYDVVVRGAVA